MSQRISNKLLFEDPAWLEELKKKRHPYTTTEYGVQQNSNACMVCAQGKKAFIHKGFNVKVIPDPEPEPELAPAPITTFSRLEDGIRQCPMSYLPALTLTVLEMAVKKKVWASPEALHRVVDKQIQRFKE